MARSSPRQMRTKQTPKAKFLPQVQALEARELLSLTPMVQATGAVSLSLDGFGTQLTTGGIIQVEKPAGATVRSAFMASALIAGGGSPLTQGDVTIDGASFSWSSVVTNGLGTTNAWADVTALIKPKVDAAPAGRVDFTILEPLRPHGVDGEILAVIFDDPNVATSNTIALLFGAQQMSGDTFSLLLGNPVDKSDASLVMNMSLGISYSSYYPSTQQYSIIDVNGQRLTTSAGGADDGDGTGSLSSGGSLITVGGLDDSNANPTDPFVIPSSDTTDDELYNLVPFVNDGDTAITVNTRNPSHNDNILFAAFYLTTPAVIGQGIVLGPNKTSLIVGSTATQTATIQDDKGSPVVGRAVNFLVASGPNAGLTGTGTTNAAGKATFSYTSSLSGTDVVQASFVNNQSQTVISNTTQVIWQNAAGVTITQSDGSTNVTEGGNSDSYTVVLNAAPSANVTISLHSDSQVTVSRTSLTFTPTTWNSPQTVTLQAINDTVVEGPHTGIITHTATSSAANYNGLAIASVTACITDNDFALPAGVTITQFGGNTVALKGGAADNYTAVLTSPPAADVTISINPGANVSVTPATLVFTAANWDVPQYVLVNGLNPGNATIHHTATSGDSAYNGLAIDDVPVTILDKTGLIITGTPGNDIIRVQPTPDLSQLLVSVNGANTFVPLSTSQLVINAGNGNDTIQITNPLIPMFVDADGGTDTLTVYGQDATNTILLDGLTLTVNSQLLTTFGLENLNVNGFTGIDTFTVQSNPDPSLKSITFNGGLGNDTLHGPNASNLWKITASNGGLLNNAIKFTAMENLTGGSSYDTFSFSLGKNLTGRIDGGGGNDVLDQSLSLTLLTFNLQTGLATGVAGGIQNIETILAGKSTNDRLIGPDGNQSWHLSGKNGGDVAGVFFQNIENLTGGTGNDTFILADAASLTGKIDGGAGTGDTLNYAAYTTPVGINLQAKKATALGGFANIESVRGGSVANTLIGANLTNSWNLTGSNAGQITNPAGSFTFTGFGNLLGGAGVDTFSGTGSWTGKLDGGLGLDTLAGSDSNHAWNITTLNAGTYDGLPFGNIENLKGGNGVDTFTLAAGQKVTGKIDGGLGSDILDYSAYTTAVVVNLATGKASGAAGIMNLEQYRAGSNVNNSLTAANLTNAWNLTATNAGNFTNSAGTFNFTGFQNLTGGSLDDAFTLALADAWTGYLQGGLGSDSLTAFGTGNQWTIAALNGHKFGSIEITI